MFFILPVGVDYRARRYPVVTFTLMSLCVLVYLISALMTASGGEAAEVWILQHLWLIPSESGLPAYLTSMFVHGGLIHLVGNMIFLFLFGSCVEDHLGRLRFTLFYLACGLAAAFAHIIMTPGHFSSDIPIGGASGAIAGCIGGFLLFLAKTKIEFKWLIFLWFRIFHGNFRLPAWLVISFWFLEDFALMVLTASSQNEGGGVAFAAHVGGTLFGLGSIALVKRHLEIESEPDDEEPAPAPSRAAPMIRLQPRPAAAPFRLEAPTIYLFMNGEQSGPFTKSLVQQMFSQGTIPADALYWQEGMENWISANDLREPAQA